MTEEQIAQLIIINTYIALAVFLVTLVCKMLFSKSSFGDFDDYLILVLESVGTGLLTGIYVLLWFVTIPLTLILWILYIIRIKIIKP